MSPSSQPSQQLVGTVPSFEGSSAGRDWHLLWAGDPVGADLTICLCDSWKTTFPSLPSPPPPVPLLLLDLLLCHPPALAGLGLARASGSCIRPPAIPARAEGSRKRPSVAPSGLGLLPAHHCPAPSCVLPVRGSPLT